MPPARPIESHQRSPRPPGVAVGVLPDEAVGVLPEEVVVAVGFEPPPGVAVASLLPHAARALMARMEKMLRNRRDDRDCMYDTVEVPGCLQLMPGARTRLLQTKERSGNRIFYGCRTGFSTVVEVRVSQGGRSMPVPHASPSASTKQACLATVAHPCRSSRRLAPRRAVSSGAWLLTGCSRQALPRR